MEGKCALFKEFAGVDGFFPICLDTQDAEQIIACVKSIAPVFGGINLETLVRLGVLKSNKGLSKNWIFRFFMTTSMVLRWWFWRL